jgi:hypothetical protein
MKHDYGVYGMNGDEGLIHGLKVTEIPGYLHAENWVNVGETGSVDNTLSNLRHAHSQLLPALADIVLMHLDVMKNPLQTEMANLQQAYSYSSRRANSVRDTVERAIYRTREVIVEIDDATTRVPNAGPAENLRLYSDRLHAMSSDDRRKRIVQAIEEDDRPTLAALFGVSGWANGLSKAELDHYRDLDRKARFPEALERRAILERALDLAERSVKAFDEKIGSMYDKKKLADAAAAPEAAQRRLNGGGF